METSAGKHPGPAFRLTTGLPSVIAVAAIRRSWSPTWRLRSRGNRGLSTISETSQLTLLRGWDHLVIAPACSIHKLDRDFVADAVDVDKPLLRFTRSACSARIGLGCAH